MYYDCGAAAAVLTSSLQIHHVSWRGSLSKATKSTRSWPMSGRKRYGSTLTPRSLTLYSLAIQDFEAARQKALKVGAKKFFLEVRLRRA